MGVRNTALTTVPGLEFLKLVKSRVQTGSARLAKKSRNGKPHQGKWHCSKMATNIIHTGPNGLACLKLSSKLKTDTDRSDRR